MEIAKGSIVVFVDGMFALYIKFVVVEITDGLLLLQCGVINYRIGNISPDQVKVVE